MEGSPNSFGGWTWWFLTAVLVAILVNLASAYLKPKFDRYLEGYSTSRKIANEKKRRKLEREVADLQNDPAELSILLHRSAQFRSFWVTFLSLATLHSVAADLTSNSQTGFRILALGFMTIGIVGFSFWMRAESVLLEYRSSKNKSVGVNTTPNDSIIFQEYAEQPTDHSPEHPD